MLWEQRTKQKKTKQNNELFKCIILDSFIIIKGSRTGHFVKVSLWHASLLTNTRFRFLYFRVSNC